MTKNNIPNVICMGTDRHSHTGTLVGLYDIVKFTKITKDSTNLHDIK
jgi:hypothetical protein